MKINETPIKEFSWFLVCQKNASMSKPSVSGTFCSLKSCIFPCLLGLVSFPGVLAFSTSFGVVYLWFYVELMWMKSRIRGQFLKTLWVNPPLGWMTVIPSFLGPLSRWNRKFLPEGWEAGERKVSGGMLFGELQEDQFFLEPTCLGSSNL